jgi:APA family basic amino acid/polyamine antiporter/amino acid efflux transporter
MLSAWPEISFDIRPCRLCRESSRALGEYSVSYLIGGSYLFGLPAIAFIGSEYIRQLFSLSDSGAVLCAFLLVTLMFVSNLFGQELLP